MSNHKVELRPYKSVTLGKRSFEINAPQRHVMVDGQFVGYVSVAPGCGLTLIDILPQEIVAAVKDAVEKFWDQEVTAISQAKPIEEDENDED